MTPVSAVGRSRLASPGATGLLGVLAAGLVQADLLGTVGLALEPAHASVWLGGGRS
jgi:hypothetical protein